MPGLIDFQVKREAVLSGSASFFVNFNHQVFFSV